MTGAETLGVVYGLIKNMKVVMEGACHLIVNICVVLNTNLVDGKASTDDIRQILGASSSHVRMSIVLNLCPIVVMQELVMKMNMVECS